MAQTRTYEAEQVKKRNYEAEQEDKKITYEAEQQEKHIYYAERMTNEKDRPCREKWHYMK